MRYAQRFNYTTQGVTVDVVEAQDAKGRRYFLATNIAASPKRILRLFKRRWGIETGYRKIREFLPKTTSRSRLVRIFNFIFACLVYNAWVVLNAKAHNNDRPETQLHLAFHHAPPDGDRGVTGMRKDKFASTV